MAKNYKNDFLNLASKLDALTDSYCELSKLAANIAKKNDENNIVLLCKKLSEIRQDFGNSTKLKPVMKTFYESFIAFEGHQKVEQLCKNELTDVEDCRTLEELLEELNSLTGLNEVKEKVHNLIAYQQVRKLREYVLYILDSIYSYY